MGKLLQSPLLTAPLVLLAGFLLLNIIKISPEKSDLNKKVANLERELRHTEEEIKDVEQKADYYGSQQYKERQARLRLDYKKPGESVIFVYENPVETESAEDAGNDTASEILPFWKKILDYIFD